MCTHAARVHMAHRGRQTHSKSTVPSRAALAYFSLKLWLLGCRTSLALAVSKQARQKPGVCSAGPRQSHILASFFCHPFPKAQHHSQAREAVSGVPLPCCTPGSSNEGWHIPECISAALRGLNSQFLKSFAQGCAHFSTCCFAWEKQELNRSRSPPWYSSILTPLLLPVVQVGGGGTWE